MKNSSKLLVGLLTLPLLTAACGSELPDSPEAFFPADANVVLSISFSDSNQAENWDTLKEKMGWSLYGQYLTAIPEYQQFMELAGEEFEVHFAMANFNPDTEEGDMFLMIKADDPEGMVTLMSPFAREVEEIEDLPVYVDDSNEFYAAITDDYLFLANSETALEASLTREEEESFKASSAFDNIAVLEEDGYLLKIYADFEYFIGLMATDPVFQSDVASTQLLNSVVGSELGLVVSAEEDRFVVEGSYLFAKDSPMVGSYPDAPKVHLYEMMPSEGLMYYAENWDLSSQLDWLFSLSGEEDANMAFLGNLTETDLGFDIEELLDGSYAFAVHENAEGGLPDFTVLIESSEEELAGMNLDALLDSMFNEEEQPGVYTKTETTYMDGGRLITVDINSAALPAEIPSDFPYTQVHFAVFTDYFLITSSDIWLEGGHEMLSDNETFKAVSSEVEMGQSLSYLDGTQLVPLIEDYLTWVASMEAANAELTGSGMADMSSSILMAMPFVEGIFGNFQGFVAVGQSEVEGEHMVLDTTMHIVFE